MKKYAHEARLAKHRPLLLIRIFHHNVVFFEPAISPTNSSTFLLKTNHVCHHKTFDSTRKTNQPLAQQSTYTSPFPCITGSVNAAERQRPIRQISSAIHSSSSSSRAPRAEKPEVGRDRSDWPDCTIDGRAHVRLSIRPRAGREGGPLRSLIIYRSRGEAPPPPPRPIVSLFISRLSSPAAAADAAILCCC